MRCLLLALLVLLPASAQTPPWRWTDDWTMDRVLQQPEAFLDEFTRHERLFFQQARHPETGLTYDGWDLDESTGRPIRPRLVSAASKECLDVAILSKAVLGDRRALMLVEPEEAVAILRRKLQSYRDWRDRYPASGGFMPWWSGGQGAQPTDNWDGSIPALDNGEWVWAMLVAEKALRDRGYTELASEYHELNESMMAACNLLYDGRVKSDLRILPMDRPQHYLEGEHGVHEGVMMVMYVTLFGKDVDAERLWSGTELVRVETPWGTTWQGFWGSSHEEWAFLFMPYFDVPEYRKLFHVRQVIRTNNAAMRGYRGLHASAHNPVVRAYSNDSGIEGINTQPLKSQDSLALYGAFPVILDNHRVGSAWLFNMLDAPKMQGPMGSGESVSQDGQHVAPIKTIDGTFPILLAAMGGLQQETAAALRERGVLARFEQIMAGEYRETFGARPLQQRADLALPPSAIPAGADDYRP